MRFCLLTFLSVMCGHSTAQSTSRTPPAFEGALELTEVVSKPNLRVGIAGGEFVEIIHKGSPRFAGPLDLSGYLLVTDTLCWWRIPQGTTLRPGQFLVIDFSGGTVARKVPPGSGAMVLRAPFRNDFFQNRAGGGMANSLILVDTKLRIMDGLVFGPAVPSVGPITQVLSSTRGWDFLSPPHWVRNTFDPFLGDIGFARRDRFGRDLNRASDWAEGNNIGPTPGSWTHWTGTEGEITGLVLDQDGNRVTGATVRVLGTMSVAVTNKRGFYRLKNVLPGFHDLRVDKVGYVRQFYGLRYKPAHSRIDQNVRILEETGENTAKGTITPAGGIVKGQGFEVAFDPGFVKDPIDVTVSFQPPGFHPATNRATWRGLPGPRKGERYSYRTFGSLVVRPDLSSATKGAFARCMVQLPNSHPDDKAGERVEVDTVTSDGTVISNRAGGKMVSRGGRLWVAWATRRFSTQDIWKKMKCRNGLRWMLRIPDDGEETDDPDRDGIPNRKLFKCTVCPKGTCRLGGEVSVSAGVSDSGGWSWGANVKGETGKLVKWIAKIEAGISKKWSGTKTTSHTFTRGLSFDAVCPYELPKAKPPDKQLCVFVVMYDVYLLRCEHCFKSGRTCNDIEFAVPSGVDYYHITKGHCGPRK